MVKLLILGQDSPKAKVLTISGELEAYSVKIPDAALLICRAADYYLFWKRSQNNKKNDRCGLKRQIGNIIR